MIPHEIIPIFSQLWWQSNIFTTLAIVLLIMTGKRLSETDNLKFSKIIGIVLLTRVLVYHSYMMITGVWTLESSLPLQMCGITSILAGIVLIWRNQFAYEILFYWGITGAFHSFLSPEFTTGINGYLFFDYYLSHGGIMFSALYLTIIAGMRPRKWSWFKIFLFTQLVLPTIGSVNYLLDANYMYLSEAPIANNPFIFTREWPWYILGLEFAAILHYIFIYIPVGIEYKRKQTVVQLTNA